MSGRRTSTSSCRAQFPQVGNNLKTGKVLSKEIEAELKQGIDAFNKTWTASKNTGITKADL